MENNKEQHFSASGIPIKDIYAPGDVKDINYDRDIGFAGKPPFTRGVYSTMYRDRPWTIRRLSGFDTPEETNKRYRQEYELGQASFSVAPDMSTHVGMDADDPRLSAEVGHAGVPINSLEDMETTFEGLPIDKLRTYLVDRVGGTLTAMYFVMAEKRGIDIRQLIGSTMNDPIVAISTVPLQDPCQALLRVSVDFIEWCSEFAPKWHPVVFDSYPCREQGINAIQELGMLLAGAIQVIDEEKRRGRVPLDRFVGRFAFNTAVHNDFFEEIAKLRAARRMWYKIIRERYGIEDPRCAQFRVHVQTAGSTHTTQEPLNNLIRIAYQVLFSVLGGAQSIHANGYDEGICLPTEESMLLAIRTEQIAALETNVTNTIDPLGGSYYVESLTSELEKRTWEYIQKIEDMGGMAEAVNSGWVHREYVDAIIEHERKLASGEITVVGVNKFRLEEEPHKVPIFQPNPQSREIQIEKLRRLKKERDNAKVIQALQKLEEVNRSDENVFPAIMEAVKAHATLGEITNVQRKVYGSWHYPMGIWSRV